MATLEELVVSLVAETSGLRAELDKASRATQTATDKMDKAIEEFTNNSGKNVGFFQTSMATMAGFLGSQVVIGAFNQLKDAAGFLFNSLVVDGIKAASATEDAMNALNTALALTGQYSRSTSKEFADFAQEMQNTTRYGDDAVLSTAALIQNLGKLDKEGLKKATQASIDLASALQIDLKAAATLVGKAATGEISSFTRYGLAIEKGSTNAQTFANTLKKLESLQGSAGAQAKTYAGQTDILTHSWEDLTKIVGNAVIQNQTLLAIMSAVNAMVQDSTKSLEENQTAYKELVANGIIGFVNIIGITIESIDLLVRSFQVMFGVIETLATALKIPEYAFKAMTEGWSAFTDEVKTDADAISKNLFAFGEQGDGVLADMAKRFAELSVAGQNGLEQIKAGADGAIEPTVKAGVAVKELTEAEKARQDQIKEFAKGLADQTTAVGSEYAFQLDLLKANLDAKTITEEDYHKERMDALIAQQEEELATLEAYHQMKGGNDKTYNDAKLALLGKQALDVKKFQQDQTDYEKLTNKQRAANLRSTLGTMATLSESGNSTLAAIGKASAISIATIDGFVAVQKAIASAPPPFGFALAAVVGVATAANIAKIAGVQLNKGGTVPGAGPNVDSVPAMLTPGEEVVNRSTAEKLREFLDNQSSGAYTVEISLKDNLAEFIEAKIVERRRIGTALI